MNIFKLKLKTIRGSLAVVLLKELLQELKVTQGDSLLAAETGSGLLLLHGDAQVEEGAARTGFDGQAPGDL
jgi:hypothetical protein